MQLTFTQSASPEFLDLIWSTFFLEKRRGRSVSEHVPWLSNPRSVDAWIATVCDDQSHPVAGLVVKRQSGLADTALIGLVCVRTDLRGQGLSQTLLSGAIREAEVHGMTCLTLWTGKPTVYRKHGFDTRDQALFGVVRNLETVPVSNAAPTARMVWPDEEERHTKNRGLPAFAAQAYRLTDGLDRAGAIVVVDANGPIVAEWVGDDVHVARLLQASLPATWRLNALQGDSLIEALKACGLNLDLCESQLQMWRGGASQTGLPDLRLLDRI
jgi:GNAT superfamily N-acetyltransferase